MKIVGFPWKRVWYVRGLPWKLAGKFGSRDDLKFNLVRLWIGVTLSCDSLRVYRCESLRARDISRCDSLRVQSKRGLSFCAKEAYHFCKRGLSFLDGARRSIARNIELIAERHICVLRSGPSAVERHICSKAHMLHIPQCTWIRAHTSVHMNQSTYLSAHESEHIAQCLHIARTSAHIPPVLETWLHILCLLARDLEYMDYFHQKSVYVPLQHTLFSFYFHFLFPLSSARKLNSLVCPCSAPCTQISTHVAHTPQPHKWREVCVCVDTCSLRYGVATISRLLKIIGLFCKRAL